MKHTDAMRASAVVLASVVVAVVGLAAACWFPGAPIRTTGRPVPSCASPNPSNLPCDPDDTPSCMADGERYECDRPAWRKR